MSILFRALLIICCCTLPALAWAANSTVYDVRLGLQGNRTRLVIESNGTGTITIAEGEKTDLSMPAFRFLGQVPTLKPVYNVSFINVNGQTGLVSLRFKKPMRLVSKMSLPPAAHKDARRYVFDFALTGAAVMNTPDMFPAEAPQFSGTLPVPEPETERMIATTRPVPMDTGVNDVTLVKSQPHPMTVVIDAGHGGKDPGAIAGDGSREKDITLATAKAVREELRRRGYNVYLTRDTDTFIPLRQRVNIARKYKADLFISIHADSVASRRSSAKGASVYTLSNVSSDKETAALAARENQADIIGGIDLSHEDKDVANILIDLAMRDTMNQSKKLANTLVAEFAQDSLTMRSPAHRFAGFAVLKAADVPSILLEIGYLSNPDEARSLVSSSHQSRLARSIANTVDTFATRHRPSN